MSDPLATPFPSGRELAFLELGERLRQRGQLEAAAAVAQAGLTHYPALADAHDLLARVAADQGDDERARAAWRAALECSPDHAGAHKGLAFLAYRAKDFVTAERHLDAAVRRTPHDPALLAALDRVRAARPTPVSETPLSIVDPDLGFLLFDARGMRMAGGLGIGIAETIADATAAEAAGLTREARRSAKLLGLGAWQRLVLEGVDTRVALLPVGTEATLLACRPGTTPVGRLLAVATRAVAAAHEWLELMD